MDNEANLNIEVYNSEDNSQTEGLEINTEIYRKDTDINSSLESIFGYRVFSDAFNEKMQSVVENEKGVFYQDYNNVFTQEYIDDINQNYMCVIESKQPLVIREEYYQYQEEIKMGSFWYFLFGMLLAVIVFLGIKKMKGKKRI